ncbi:transketolase 1 [Rhodovastum atsumiense]|uniref:Transketolase n=1 Tax=Rhodovastum atsumiense TaxID=504468 RepID=A0A5M6IZP9_9PROT|nr:transketolase [Rhodovastum atsumiense]KAA5613812.1 transketolase [Rhodovastum atsumiense]CAH2601912.1 transketolase 1 [Rhodovastum atsumiense]
MTDVTTRDMANAVRALAMDAVERAKSGHPGMPMGMADVATVLWTQFLRFDPQQPDWPDRDRFVLSAGHGSMLLYALLHLTGFPGIDIEELKRFRQLGAKTAGHPEYGHAPGIETTTGPLGQGISTAVGMALAERMLAERHGSDLVDHWTYVIAGDGCLMEGISHEAASLAGHLGLGRLVVLWDDNGISIDGPTSLTISEDTPKRFAAYGWHVQSVDGHDPAAVAAAITAAKADTRPSLIACRTTIGYGAPTKAGKESSHGAPLGEAEILGARDRLNWPFPPFVIPPAIQQAWAATGARGQAERLAWEQRLETAAPQRRAAFEQAQRGTLTEAATEALAAFRRKLVETKPSLATRKSSEETLKVLAGVVPELVGGSADLTHSNLTVVHGQKPVGPGSYGGSYIHWGVREHAMAAGMNGIALHGGLIPYGGTFLVFSDYARGGIRLSALMGARVVYVMTHDSIGLGEDGPTHQPIEHLISLRAIPNLLVFRPADAVETAEAWEVALTEAHAPSLLALSRQNLPTLRTDVSENLTARGGYVLAEASGPRAITILATGSEVVLAIEARTRLEAEGVPTAVVSLPCWELFERQDAAWRAGVLGTAPRLAIEAASTLGWTRYVASEDDVVGMRGFGASAPAPALYKEFGITADRLVELARAKLARPDAA